MIFRQVIQEDLGCASYLIGDAATGRAAVVDPRFDVDIYLELADLLEVEITDLLETHTHADHVSGRGRLAAISGAAIHLNPESGAAYPHEPLADGDEVRFGEVVIRAVHSPGHRPEHTAFAVYDRARSEQPWAILSGDSLLVGDVARPDLAVEKREGARLLHASLHAILDAFPPETELWPGHVGGSTCGGAGLDMKTSSTLGFERASNPFLGLSEEEFVDELLASLGPQPANLENIVEINRGPLIETALEIARLSPDQALALLDVGAVVVDVRSAEQFDAGHIPGAVSVPGDHTGIGTAVGWTVGAETPIVFVGGTDERALQAVAYAEAVGIRRIEGILAGGMRAWLAPGRPTAAIERLERSQLAERAESNGLQVLDVRDPDEREGDPIEATAAVPYREIEDVPSPLDPDKPIAVVCTGGRRAGIAASLLQRYGAEDVIHVTPSNGGSK